MAEPTSTPASSMINETSKLASPPSSAIPNETLDKLAPPPAPVTQSPSPESNSPPPPISEPPVADVPPPPDSKSLPPPISPPPNSNGSTSPPNPFPLPPPPNESTSPPPSIFPPPPPSSTPPPSPPPHDPPLPIPPPSTHNQSSPPPNLPPPPKVSPPSHPMPIIVSPPPNSLPPPPPPPLLTLSPPAQVVTPPMPKTPSGNPPSSPLPMSPPKPSTPTTNPPNQTAPVKPYPSTPSDSKPPNSVSNVTPSSRQGDSSSGSSATVAVLVIVGVIFAVAVVASVAIFFVVSRKKKNKTNGLASQYRPAPSNFSMEPDGQYHRTSNTAGHSSNSDAYYATKPSSPLSAAGNSYGSYRGHRYHAGFTYEELMDITNGFSRENLIGEGGFGRVYKGCLPDGRTVAVKQLKVGSGQGEREFRAEVEIISRVHHRHLVSLVGYCISEHHRLLVYEFVPNKTLEHHLHGKELPALNWPKRMKIAIGSARGLAYLHEDCHPRIIHRDIKSANILLENSFEAQVADFGLARLTNDAHTHVSTRVVGTFGYMAPEYASSGKLTDRSDVFSFGVVLLELITGRKPVDPSQPLGDESLVEWARPLLVRALEVGDHEELVDPRLENNFVKSEMLRMIEVATACVRHSAPKRPRMVQVLRALDSEGDLADLSNGVKFGQSVVYDSSQYSADIQKFRKMAFGSEEFSSSDYGHSESTFSGDSQSKEVSYLPLELARPQMLSSGEHETRHGSENRTM